jgi:hypothetical protein
MDFEPSGPYGPTSRGLKESQSQSRGGCGSCAAHLLSSGGGTRASSAARPLRAAGVAWQGEGGAGRAGRGFKRSAPDSSATPRMFSYAPRCAQTSHPHKLGASGLGLQGSHHTTSHHLHKHQRVRLKLGCVAAHLRPASAAHGVAPLGRRAPITPAARPEAVPPLEAWRPRAGPRAEMHVPHARGPYECRTPSSYRPRSTTWQRRNSGRSSASMASRACVSYTSCRTKAVRQGYDSRTMAVQRGTGGVCAW